MRRGVGALLTGLLALATTACAATPPVRALPLVVTGSVGPFAQAQVRIAYDDPALAEGFRAEVSSADGPMPLEWPAPSPDFFMVRWLDVAIADVAPLPGNEIAILYASQRRGPATPMAWNTLVFGWDGKAFVALPAVAARADGIRSLKKALRRLKAGPS
jgi:hypothetical protein